MIFSLSGGSVQSVDIHRINKEIGTAFTTEIKIVFLARVL